MEKQVVVRLLSGKMFKGMTSDFHPAKDKFTINVSEGPWKGENVSLALSSIKAVFFVRSLSGDSGYKERKMKEPENLPGEKVTVIFLDGETLRGTTMGLNLGLSGFYLFPADQRSNNKRVFIVRSAVKSVKVEEEK